MLVEIALFIAALFLLHFLLCSIYVVLIKSSRVVPSFQLFFTDFINLANLIL